MAGAAVFWLDAGECFLNVLTATGPRGPLFTVEITDPATGAYQVTLLTNVLNAGGPNDEATDAVVNIAYLITDADGSVAVGSVLTVIFDDDAHGNVPGITL